MELEEVGRGSETVSGRRRGQGKLENVIPISKNVKPTKGLKFVPCYNLFYEGMSQSLREHIWTR